MRLFVQDALRVFGVGHALSFMIEETLGVEDLAAVILVREIQTHIVDRPRAYVGDFPGHHEVRRHAARIYNLVVRDVDFQVVVLYDLGLGMIVSPMYVRRLARLLAIFHLDMSAGESDASRAKS
jgi:hypothetical protein